MIRQSSLQNMDLTYDPLVRSFTPAHQNSLKTLETVLGRQTQDTVQATVLQLFQLVDVIKPEQTHFGLHS